MKQPSAGLSPKSHSLCASVNIDHSVSKRITIIMVISNASASLSTLIIPSVSESEYQFKGYHMNPLFTRFRRHHDRYQGARWKRTKASSASLCLYTARSSTNTPRGSTIVVHVSSYSEPTPVVSPNAAMSSKSPLLGLPAELRNHIYSAILASERPSFRLEHGHMEPAHLSTCRQIRSEFSGIFYANTTLEFGDPDVCVRKLSSMSPKLVGLIQELRYDTAAACVRADTWRTAFRELPGLDEDTKLEALRDELAKKGVVLRKGILKARILISCRPMWTSDPLGAALDAVKQGILVGRMMFV